MRSIPIPRARRRAALLATVVAVLASRGSSGQGAGLPPEKVLGKDDAQFARELSRAGYTDLAEDIRKALERGGTGPQALQAQMLALELDQEQGQREPDPMKRIALLEGLINSRDAFIRDHAGTPEAAQLRDGQVDLYRSVGELITQVLQEKGKGAEADALRKRGEAIFEQAVSVLEERLTAMSKTKEGTDAPGGGAPPTDPLAEPPVDLEKMLTSYGLARTLYFRALLYDATSFERTVIARKALKVLLDFQLEYPENLLTYEGYVYEGLCHKALGKPEDAAESFDAAIHLRETYEQSKGVYQMDPAAADIVSSAVLQKMLLLEEGGDNPGAVAVAKDFLATTQEPWKALRGLAVLSNLAETYKTLGDQKALAETARTLMEVDPHGPGGQRGRELLGQDSAGTLGAVETLRLAESFAGSDPDKAIPLCQKAMALARGTADQNDLGARAGLLLGALFAQKGMLQESVVAWDTAADRYEKGKVAPDCLWRAINGYLALQGQERRPIYKTLAQERVSALLKRYPDNPYASMAGLVEGQQAEAEQDYVRAAQVYERIAPGAGGYEEALYRAGNAWSLQARKLFKDKQTADAKQAVQKAEAALIKARTALTDAAAKTLETSTQERMRSLAFSSRVALANLYLMDGVKRAAEVAPLFEGQDAGLDAARSATVWDLRFRALEAQGKRDEAITLLDTQIRRDPNAAWVEGGARTLGPALDARGSELFKTDPKSTEAESLWRKAAGYYLIAIKGQLDGRESVEVESLEAVADRLLVFALHFEGVPDKVESFADYAGPRIRNDMLDTAMKAYEAVLPLTPSYRTMIKSARALGFLGRWEEAAALYAGLFERESFANTVTKTIDQQVVAAKPELLFAYLEWGVCEREVGTEHSDVSRLTRAKDIFEALVTGTVKESRLWWVSKYYQMRTLFDRGDYEILDAGLANLQLNYEHFDNGQYGLEPRFAALRDDVKKKVFR